MLDHIDNNLSNIINGILDDTCFSDINNNCKAIDIAAIANAINDLETILFPTHFAKNKSLGSFALKAEMNSLVANVYTTFCTQIANAFTHDENFQTKLPEELLEYADNITTEFFNRLPIVREYLKTDIQAAYDGDPAAYNKDEIVFSYPGFHAIMVNRLAHELFLLKVPMVPRTMTELAHSRTGADIHPGATIGKYFFIDHATGVVIGETTIIGEHVKIYQGVTLGGLSTRAGQGLKGVKRHPTIEDNVTIYSNASILGGETIIGKGCTIAGNAFITRSIDPYMRVSNQQSELVISPDPKVYHKS